MNDHMFFEPGDAVIRRMPPNDRGVVITATNTLRPPKDQRYLVKWRTGPDAGKREELTGEELEHDPMAADERRAAEAVARATAGLPKLPPEPSAD